MKRQEQKSKDFEPKLHTLLPLCLSLAHFGLSSFHLYVPKYSAAISVQLIGIHLLLKEFLLFFHEDYVVKYTIETINKRLYKDQALSKA